MFYDGRCVNPVYRYERAFRASRAREGGCEGGSTAGDETASTTMEQSVFLRSNGYEVKRETRRVAGRVKRVGGKRGRGSGRDDSEV